MNVDTSLYIIGTPLGNVEDITLRARAVLKDLKHLFAEDTRELSKLLNLLEISVKDKKLHSYSSHNMKEATVAALKVLKTESVGLVSDRGMPGISDPGAYLVEAVRTAGVEVKPIPGPSAITTLYAVTGLASTEFHFVGFLPTIQKYRSEMWKRLRDWPLPICFFESPNRIQKTLEELAQEFPKGRVFLGREMTKQFEEFRWLALADLNSTEIVLKGEFTVLLDPGDLIEKEKWTQEVEERVLSDKEWAKRVASRSECSASEIYNALQQVKNTLKKTM
jgi:16S rRNA (cytidine1402-2'-O)-methyltransferase